MLAALIVFSLVAVLASQSIGTLARDYRYLTRAYADSDVALQADTLLRNYVQALNGGVAETSNPGQDPALWIETGEAGVRLILSDAGEARAIGLPSGIYDLRVETDALGGRLVVLRRGEAGDARVIAMAPIIQTQPQDCRYDIVSRRCV